MNHLLHDKIFQLISRIPPGKVMTYGQIANMVGTGPRVVGNILHKNTSPETCPCHRVIRSDGSLAAGFAFGGAEAQRSKLEIEGFRFNGLKIANIDNRRFVA